MNMKDNNSRHLITTHDIGPIYADVLNAGLPSATLAQHCSSIYFDHLENNAGSLSHHDILFDI